jgi:hypothetical protein
MHDDRTASRNDEISALVHVSQKEVRAPATLRMGQLQHVQGSELCRKQQLR